MDNSTIAKEIIPNEDNVYRNIHFSQLKKYKPKRRPNETDFIPGEDGLSVNWDKYCTIDYAFILIGLHKKNNGNYLKPNEFQIIRFNVGELRDIKLVDDKRIDDVVHDPQIENKSHSLVCFNDDEEIRLKMCDIVEADYDNRVLKPDSFPKIDEKLLKLREEFRAKDTNE